MRLFKVGDLVVLRAEGRVGEVAGTMSVGGELLYIINFYDRVDPRQPLVTHKQNELGRVIR
jgi:hypothetical protein